MITLNRKYQSDWRHSQCELVCV